MRFMNLGDCLGTSLREPQRLQRFLSFKSSMKRACQIDNHPFYRWLPEYESGPGVLGMGRIHSRSGNYQGSCLCTTKRHVNVKRKEVHSMSACGRSHFIRDRAMRQRSLRRPPSHPKLPGAASWHKQFTKRVIEVGL